MDTTVTMEHNMSSPPSKHPQSKRPKFTKGEKCLFTYLVVTFSLIVLTSIIYFIHLLVVKHTKNQALNIYRRTQPHTLMDVKKADYQYVGMLHMNESTTVICNTLLLKKQWSLAPGQCTSMRTDPVMAYYLLMWRITYKNDTEYFQSNIKQTLTHSHFNRGDYDNNIGLIEHVDPIPGMYYVAPNNIVLNDDKFKKNAKKMFLLDWDGNVSGDLSYAVVKPVIPVNYTRCSSSAVPIVETLRSYEFCVIFGTEYVQPFDHGAMFVMNSTVIGFFSWGDIQGRDSIVILNILNYRQWFENIIL